MVKIGISGVYFLPWLGYYDKIRKSDIIIILDNIQRTSHGYSGRVQIKTPQGPFWLNIPRIKAGFQQIQDVKIDQTRYSPDYILKTLQHCYNRSPFFKEQYPPIHDIFTNNWVYLINLNMTLIKYFYDLLELKTKIIMASELDIQETLRGTDRVVSLVKSVSGDTYIYGGGAKGYQVDEIFYQNNIKLIGQNFNHPKYPQRFEKFIPGMSLIDLLFNIGIDATIELLEDSFENWMETQN